MWGADLQPKLFGWFHILGMVLAVGFGYGGVLLGRKFKETSDKGKAILILSVAEAALVLLEVVKQIFYTLESGSYRWDMFPMQICSVIIFVLPVAIIAKRGVVKNSALGFVGFCSLAGAIFYFFNPAAAFNTPYVLMSLHSFLWHWIMIATGTFVIVSFDLLRKSTVGMLVGSYAVWFVFAVVAAVSNNVANFYAPELNVDYYHIGYVKVIYPLLNIVFKRPEPYVPFFLCFLVYYALGTVAIYFAAKGVTKFNNKLFPKPTEN